MRESRNACDSASRVVAARIALLLGGFIAGPGCGGSVSVGPDGSVGVDAAGGSDAGVGGDALVVSSPSCPAGSPLACYVDMHCPDGGRTSLSGTVYDPAGRNPVYEAVVFVPNDPANVPPIATGAPSCRACDVSIGDFVNFAFTDFAGHFTLTSVPTGENVPLVIQIGKWRRTIAVPQVRDCTDTAVASDLTRLPRNQKEGDLPQMALLTGACDNLACFLRSVGVDASEFSSPHAGGRVEVYQGLGAVGTGATLSNGVAGDCTTDACPLWSSKQSLEPYDAVLLGCECGENNQTKPASSLLALRDYLDQGGTVFAIHSQATWFKNGPAEFQAVANWTDGPVSGATGPFVVNTTSAKGQALERWLASVGAADRTGVVPLVPADVSTSVTTVSPTTTDWIDDESTVIQQDGGVIPPSVKALSFRTPIALPDASEGSRYCGTAYFTDIHAGGGQALQDTSAGGSGSPASIPGACDGGPMTAEEKALEFLFFYQSPCVSQPPVPPPPPVGGSIPSPPDH